MEIEIYAQTSIYHILVLSLPLSPETEFLISEFFHIHLMDIFIAQVYTNVMMLFTKLVNITAVYAAEGEVT